MGEKAKAPAATAKNADEVRKMFSILEIGVDGVIFSTNSINEVREVLDPATGLPAQLRIFAFQRNLK